MRVAKAAGAQQPSHGPGIRTEAAREFVLPRASPAPVSVGAAGTVAGLLALQDLPMPPEERRRRAIRRGEGMLDQLAKLHEEISRGTATATSLRRLRSELARRDDEAVDAPLLEILQSIEVRCAVEIAKQDGAGAG